MQIWLTPSTGSLSKSPTAPLTLGLIPAKAGTIFQLEVYSTEALDTAAGGVLTAKADLAYTSDLAAIDTTWSKQTGPPIRYIFDLDLNTTEIAALFTTSTTATVKLMAEISWTSGTEQGKSQTFQLLVQRQVWRGDEQTPTPATVLHPVIEFVDAPSAKDDFFMFYGGVAPTAGLYQAADTRYIYTIKGGQTSWRRTPISQW